MVRYKSNPLKSLYEVDYTHPSVVFWFFGQVPTKANGSKVTLTSKEKKIEKKTKNKVQETNDRTLRNDKLAHPLSLFPDVPALTDLQIFITEAILSQDSSSCSFERIYEYVSQRWKTIRRRDGSSYATDCRRAIQANLRHNPHHIALFRRDKTKEGYWTVCHNLEESIEASKDKTSERRMKREKEELGVNGDSKGEVDEDGEENNSEDDDLMPPAESIKGESDAAFTKSENNSTSPNDTSHPTIDSATTINEQPKGESQLTELQKLVCDCINDNAGSCHFDMIVHHVSKHWNNFPNKNGNRVATVLAVLTDSKRLFKRDSKKTGWWMINPDFKPKPTSPQEDTSQRGSKSKRPRTNSNTKEPHELSSPEPIPIEAIEGSGDEGKRVDSQMTELQVLIILAIRAEGGSATFDQIQDHVSKKFDTIKRRDGTPYTSECRRAIQASLSNNPTTRPFFKKETKKGVSVWSLAKRSLEFLADNKLSDDESLNGDTAEKQNFEADETKESEEIIDNEDSEEIDEEIHDEYDEDNMDEDKNGHGSINKKDDEEEDESEKEEKPKPKEPEPKEEKHLYGNRVKRARKIKENAGRRQLREHNSNGFSENGNKDKESRFKKRRK